MNKIYAILLLLLLSTGLFANAENEGAGEDRSEVYTIGTGSQRGIYWPYGGALSKIWNRELEDFTINVEVTAASVENTLKVLNEDMLIGIAQANVVLNAYEGKGNFSEKMPVRILYSLYPNLVQLLTRKGSGIEGIDDLKGKRVSLGAPGSGTYVTSANLLKALGFDLESDIKAQSLNYTETTDGIQNKQLDAGFLVGGSGLGAITQLALVEDIRIVSLSNEEIQTVIKAHPAYAPFEVDAEVYQNVPSFNTISIWNVLVVREDLPEALAYNMAKAAYEHLDEIISTVAVARSSQPENADIFSAVPLHSGTVAYLKEIGIK